MEQKFMREALRQAKKAAELGEMPVGAVIVRDGEIISRGYNKRETKKNALLHAEIIAIDRACKKLGGWRLPDCEMYVTLEPCPMCSWAIIQSGIKTLYFGAYNPEYGILLSNPQYLPPPLANSKIKVYGGIEEDKCNKILEEFFKKIR